ncbi:MAG: hypothetical protein EAY75_16255 [Bacteroidetes bacterium]|nr:MAG: hypothetical protein EAY75_16255 [Bacteroidota bacterium]
MKINYHKLLGQLLLATLITGACTLFIGGIRTNGSAACTNVKVSMKASDLRGFVDDKELLKTICDQLKTNIIGSPIQNFNLKQLESTLESNMWINNAQLYFDNNNVLHIIVEQRYPIARIMPIDGSAFYIDSNFLKLPLSKTEQAEVPIFTGFSNRAIETLSTTAAGTIVAMSKHILADPFWLAQAAQIDFEKGKFVLYPSLGYHTCLLGDGSNAADKLNRLKWFYQTTAKTKGFDAWKSISAEFNHQIVATKPDSATASDANMSNSMLAYAKPMDENKLVTEQTQQAEASRSSKPKAAKKTDAAAIVKITPAATANSTPVKAQAAPSPQPKAVMPKNNNNN